MIVIRICVVVFFLGLLSCSEGHETDVIYSRIECLETQSKCNISTQFGDISVKFNVDVVKPEIPFSIYVDFKEKDGLDRKSDFFVSGYIEGKNMYMGKIPLFFSAFDNENRPSKNSDNQSKSFQYKSETLLGSCSEAKMIWRMWLTLTDEYGKKESHFIDFESSRV